MVERLEIRWSAKAEKRLDEIYQYILAEWGLKEADRFIYMTRQFEIIISK